MEDKPYIDNEVDLSGPPPTANGNPNQNTPPSMPTLDPRIVEAKFKINRRAIFYAAVIIILIAVQVAIIIMNQPPKPVKRSSPTTAK